MQNFLKSVEVLYINISVTYATLVFSYFFLSSDKPLNIKSPLYKRVLFGLICGAVSVYLDRDRYHLSDQIYYSFETVPMLVCVFYVGWLSALCAFLVNFFFSGMFTLDKMLLGLMLAGICYFRPWKDNNIRTFSIAVAIVVLVRTLSSVPFFSNWDVFAAFAFLSTL
ncbi:hypothetical protein AwEntero_17830 [Enterobacterales bacterium]|nr:hypothetical protein AwEntero_17830 [Enterobacterales bacterium]